MEKGAKVFFIATNPFAICIGVGIICASILKNVFGGVYKDCKQIVEQEI